MITIEGHQLQKQFKNAGSRICSAPDSRGDATYCFIVLCCPLSHAQRISLLLQLALFEIDTLQSLSMTEENIVEIFKPFMLRLLDPLQRLQGLVVRKQKVKGGKFQKKSFHTKVNVLLHQRCIVGVTLYLKDDMVQVCKCSVHNVYTVLFNILYISAHKYKCIQSKIILSLLFYKLFSLCYIYIYYIIYIHDI